MIFIANFNTSRYLEDIKACYDYNRKTNLNLLIDGFAFGRTIWSVPKKATPGDVVIFMCAKEARNNLGMATSHIPEEYRNDFKDFVKQQKALYKKYSGHLLGCGIVESTPIKDDKWWMADIYQLQSFTVPIYIDDFRSFITISRTNAITFLNNTQWKRLKWVINQKNPGFYQNVDAPFVENLNEEIEAAVHKEATKSLASLKKKAQKAGHVPSSVSVQTKYYYRDPAIAAYTKKRAKGFCQLCGEKAPFIDKNEEPYLECHHIEWLSKGGKDSIDNCVALCPNCHRKMHIINAPEDISVLKTRINVNIGD